MKWKHRGKLRRHMKRHGGAWGKYGSDVLPITEAVIKTLGWKLVTVAWNEWRRAQAGAQ